jgi:hypothetical protein
MECVAVIEYTLYNTEGVIKNGQSRATGCIEYTSHRTNTNKTKVTTQKTKKMSNTDPTKNPRVIPGTRKCQAVPASDGKPAMLLIYTVKYDTSLCNDEWKKQST